ncbi:hypothetical protein [Kribbella endophytica]
MPAAPVPGRTACQPHACHLPAPPAALWPLAPAAVVAVVWPPFVTALPLWWYRVHRWEITEDAEYVRAGYF